MDLSWSSLVALMQRKGVRVMGLSSDQSANARCIEIFRRENIPFESESEGPCCVVSQFPVIVVMQHEWIGVRSRLLNLQMSLLCSSEMVLDLEGMPRTTVFRGIASTSLYSLQLAGVCVHVLPVTPPYIRHETLCNKVLTEVGARLVGASDAVDVCLSIPVINPTLGTLDLMRRLSNIKALRCFSLLQHPDKNACCTVGTDDSSQLASNVSRTQYHSMLARNALLHDRNAKPLENLPICLQMLRDDNEIRQSCLSMGAAVTDRLAFNLILLIDDHATFTYPLVHIIRQFKALCVKQDWVLECEARGKIVDVRPYIVHPLIPSPMTRISLHSVRVHFGDTLPSTYEKKLCNSGIVEIDTAPKADLPIVTPLSSAAPPTYYMRTRFCLMEYLDSRVPHDDEDRVKYFYHFPVHSVTSVENLFAECLFVVCLDNKYASEFCVSLVKAAGGTIVEPELAWETNASSYKHHFLIWDGSSRCFSSKYCGWISRAKLIDCDTFIDAIRQGIRPASESFPCSQLDSACRPLFVSNTAAMVPDNIPPPLLHNVLHSFCIALESRSFELVDSVSGIECLVSGVTTRLPAFTRKFSLFNNASNRYLLGGSFGDYEPLRCASLLDKVLKELGFLSFYHSKTVNAATIYQGFVLIQSGNMPKLVQVFTVTRTSFLLHRALLECMECVGGTSYIMQFAVPVVNFSCTAKCSVAVEKCLVCSSVFKSYFSSPKTFAFGPRHDMIVREGAVASRFFPSLVHDYKTDTLVLTTWDFDATTSVNLDMSTFTWMMVCKSICETEKMIIDNLKSLSCSLYCCEMHPDVTRNMIKKKLGVVYGMSGSEKLLPSLFPKCENCSALPYSDACLLCINNIPSD